MLKGIDQYYKDIRRGLAGLPRELRESAVYKIKIDVNAFAADNPQTNIQEIYETFGTPEEISGAFLQSCGSNEAGIQRNTRKAVVRIAVVAAAIIVVTVIAFCAIHLYDAYSYSHGYIVTSQAYEGLPPEKENVIGSY